MFDANQAGDVGGALAYSNGGPASHIRNTTFSGNSSKADGGAIFNNQGELVLNNITIAQNVADSDQGEPGDTDSGDGGGMFNNDASAATTRLRNTIIADNQAPGNDVDCFGTLTSEGFNLIEDVSSGCTFTETSGDITGEDPLLVDLADNGGPTLTHALQAASPALDQGSCTDTDANDITEDQRGSERPADACDIGAIEVSVCGDDIIAVDEECDDGNEVDTDDCTSECLFSVCGDGFVEDGFEDCDDGNTEDGDGCDSTCVNEDIDPLGTGCQLMAAHPSHAKVVSLLLLGLALIGMVGIRAKSEGCGD